jgi:TBC1 domain-containing protein 4
MFQRQMRLNYLPDMKQFQMQLYQLSRLIKDIIPELYELFDKNDVATTLYASSWMLTIFSSCFELGFVAKVYDLLLFASNEVIFRVILSLLQVHKDELLKLDCFEDIMDYLKNVIPKIDEPTMTKVFKDVYTLNITRQLMDYKIEYNVLKEEIQNTNQHTEILKQSKEDSKAVQRQLQIAESNIERLENIRHTQQQDIQSMQIQIQSLEVTIQTLGDYLTSLSIHRTDIDIPTDIRRLLQQLEYQHNQQRQQQMKRRPIFLDRKIGKSVSVNNSLGMSLKVLVEQNENDHSLLQTPPSAVTPTVTPEPLTPGTKKKYFDKAFEQIKQQQAGKVNSRILNRESPEKPRLIEQASIDEEPNTPTDITSDHPLSSCSDINFQFNTMQLKSIKTTNNFRKQ